MRDRQGTWEASERRGQAKGKRSINSVSLFRMLAGSCNVYPHAQPIKRCSSLIRIVYPIARPEELQTAQSTVLWPSTRGTSIAKAHPYTSASHPRFRNALSMRIKVGIEVLLLTWTSFHDFFSVVGELRGLLQHEAERTSRNNSSLSSILKQSNGPYRVEDVARPLCDAVGKTSTFYKVLSRITAATARPLDAYNVGESLSAPLCAPRPIPIVSAISTFELVMRWMS
ncbi:hypothetical protein EV121DRAFT_268259 [Schizophyllum commune]